LNTGPALKIEVEIFKVHLSHEVQCVKKPEQPFGLIFTKSKVTNYSSDNSFQFTRVLPKSFSQTQFSPS